MKKINTYGIHYIEPLRGCSDWYWGCDYMSGDLYEAEELYHMNLPIRTNKLIFVHYPDGEVVCPVEAKDGQYLGCPAYHDGKLMILLVDFPKAKIVIYQYCHKDKQLEVTVELPLSEVKDCYNLLLISHPLMLTRQGSENIFQVVWPEKTEFMIENEESFEFRDGNKLYFTSWVEDPDYREVVHVRDFLTGEIIEKIPGGIMDMPDGQKWIVG